jgi:hypothetical protein
MAIRSDSYSSVDEVLAFTRHLLDGNSSFNTSTRPTLLNVEKFIDRASACVNIALYREGFLPSAIYANAVSKLVCDDWVTTMAVKYVELTQRGTGYNANEGSRTDAFSLQSDAYDFVCAYALGFQRAGVARRNQLSQGLEYTGLTAQDDRADPDNTGYEQPFAKRGQFDS